MQGCKKRLEVRACKKSEPSLPALRLGTGSDASIVAYLGGLQNGASHFLLIRTACGVPVCMPAVLSVFLGAARALSFLFGQTRDSPFSPIPTCSFWRHRSVGRLEQRTAWTFAQQVNKSPFATRIPRHPSATRAEIASLQFLHSPVRKPPGQGSVSFAIDWVQGMYISHHNWCILIQKSTVDKSAPPSYKVCLQALRKRSQDGESLSPLFLAASGDDQLVPRLFDGYRSKYYEYNNFAGQSDRNCWPRTNVPALPPLPPVPMVRLQPRCKCMVCC